jgi:hypothetical protein
MSGRPLTNGKMANENFVRGGDQEPVAATHAETLRRSFATLCDRCDRSDGRRIPEVALSDRAWAPFASGYLRCCPALRMARRGFSAGVRYGRWTTASRPILCRHRRTGAYAWKIGMNGHGARHAAGTATPWSRWATGFGISAIAAALGRPTGRGPARLRCNVGLARRLSARGIPAGFGVEGHPFFSSWLPPREKKTRTEAKGVLKAPPFLSGPS